MNHLLSAFKWAGLLAKQALSAGKPRQEALEVAGRLILEGYGPTDTGKSMAMLAPAMALAWCEQGFPSVDVGHRLAASLMCTGYSPEMCTGVVPPWRCFHLSAPNGVLGQRVDQLVLFAHSGQINTITIFGDTRLEFGMEPTLGDYATIDADYVKWNDRPFPEEWGTESQLNRELKLTGRLLAGVCMEMDGLRIRDVVRLGPPNKSGVNRRGEPSVWTFQLKRNVAVDLRPYVQQFVAGERGGHLNVQHLVRGHWRRQTIAQAREWIHIEPYWRGDKSAPIALRAHSLR